MQSTKFYIHETHGLVFTDEEIVLISKEIQEKNIPYEIQ
jgi:hypothetical protein